MMSAGGTVRIALISDIHANLHALTAVLADIDSRPDVAATYHLGDLAGYSAAPDEVAALLAARGMSGVAGNYDSTIASDHPHCGCRASTPLDEELAHASYEWTRKNTSQGTKQYLAALPFRIDLRPAGGHAGGPTVVLVHGHPNNNLIYVDATRSDDFLLKMAQAAGMSAGDVIAFGHTHVPWHREAGGMHFVNTGSVGRPKDGDWRAGYAILDVGVTGVHVEQVRVEYDVDRSAKEVRDAGLPAELAEFLRHGGHPRS